MSDDEEQIAKIKAYADCKHAAWRVTDEGKVHLHGQMPNTDLVGWWLFAHSVEEAIRLIEQDR